MSSGLVELGGETFISAELIACEYCKHYKPFSAGVGGEYYLCLNAKSPYYDTSARGFDDFHHGMSLSHEQELIGCEKIEHNGKKIRSDVFESMPACLVRYSFLRKISRDKILEENKD